MTNGGELADPGLKSAARTERWALCMLTRLMRSMHLASVDVSLWAHILRTCAPCDCSVRLLEKGKSADSQVQVVHKLCITLQSEQPVYLVVCFLCHI